MIQRILFLMLSGVILYSCSGKEDEIYTKNTISGYAFTLDQFDRRDSVNHVSVVLKSGKSSYESTSNDSGYWEIRDLPTGTYYAVISRDGYIGYESITQQYLCWEPTFAPTYTVIRKFDIGLDYFDVETNPSNTGIYFSFDDKDWGPGSLYSYYFNASISTRNIETNDIFESPLHSLQNGKNFTIPFPVHATDTVLVRLDDLYRHFSPGDKLEVLIRISAAGYQSPYFSKDVTLFPNISDPLGKDTITLQ